MQGMIKITGREKELLEEGYRLAKESHCPECQAPRGHLIEPVEVCAGHKRIEAEFKKIEARRAVTHACLLKALEENEPDGEEVEGEELNEE